MRKTATHCNTLQRLCNDTLQHMKKQICCCICFCKCAISFAAACSPTRSNVTRFPQKSPITKKHATAKSPNYRATESATHVSLQHMWVCNTCESATHVSLQHMWVCNTCESATPNYRAKESATLLLSRAPLLRQTCCSVLLHYIAVYYSVLQRVCSLISVLPPDHEVLATRCNTLQHTTIHGNTLQNTADALPLSA